MIPLRVAGISIVETNDADPVPLLWRVLDQCVVPAEQRCAHALHSGCGDIPAGLVKVAVEFPYEQSADTPILGPLATTYPALVRSLKVLEITRNDYDESVALSAFAALATQLRELSFFGCGLTSLRGLEGRCEYLRKVNLFDIGSIESLEGLGRRLYLEEVNASYTGITTIEDLRTCPNLKMVNIYRCRLLPVVVDLPASITVIR